MLIGIVCLASVLFGARESSAVFVVDLGTVVVTPGRLDQKQYKIAGNVSVITKEQIEASNAQSIPDILKEAVGVLVYDKSTSKTNVVDIRGFGDTASRNSLVMVDGRKINSSDISGPDLIQIPIGAVERIEIIRGGGSVLYGDNAVGGVVNIITKKGEGDFSGEVGGLYGSYDRRGGSVQFQGKEKGISYYVYSQQKDDKGYRQNSDVTISDFNSKVGYEVHEDLSFDVHVGWHEDRYGLPGGLSQTEIDTIGRRASTDPNDFAKTKDKFVQLTMNFSPEIDDFYVGDFVIDYNIRDRDVFDSFNSFGSYNTLRELITQGITAKYIYNHTIFDREVNFVTGIDFYDDENEITGSGSNTDALTISKAEFGVYTFLEFELFENLFINGGARYHQAEYTFDQRASSVTFEKQRPDESVNMGGLKYEYAQGSNIHANVQQTFRFLATDEWYSTFSGLNTDLKQQTGIQYEVGVKHSFNNKVVVTATPYWMDLENEIFLNPDKGFFGTNDNYDKTRRLGVELGTQVDLLKFLNIEVLDKLELFANYTYQRPQFNGGSNDGKDVPMAPRQQASHGFLTKFFEHYQFSLTGRYVGQRYAVNDTLNVTARHGSYYVVDSKLSYQAKNLEVFVEANNLFNKEYAPLIVKSTTSLAKDFFPAPELNYNLGVKVKF